MPVETSPPTIEKREELFRRFSPNSKILDPRMLDSTGDVAQAISEIVSPYYGIHIWDTQVAVDLLVHHQTGQSRRERRATTPFIRESLVADYLTRNQQSIILLDVGPDQLPYPRGLDASINKFNAIIEALSLDDYFIRGISWPGKGNPPTDVDLTGMAMRDTIFQRMRSSTSFQEEMDSLRAFQNAVSFRSIYVDPYAVTKSELKENPQLYRLQLLSKLIEIFGKKDPSVTRELKKLRYSLQHGFNFDGLRVEYGNPRDNISDAIPSCVNGLVGTEREAALTYEADPSIEILGLFPYMDSPGNLQSVKLEQIAKAITVKVEDVEDGKTKLLVDGVVADDELENILGVKFIPIIAMAILVYAKSQGIDCVVVNAENTGNYESVNAFKYFIAAEVLGLKESRDFSYDIDPKTKNHFFRLHENYKTKKLDGFAYTHHLEKDPMPEEMRHTLAASDIYQGESYLETWYSWMVHVRSRIDAWDSELKARFPYAEQRDPVMKPSWNLGRGPMIGMELDVSSVLAKLHQRYL